MAVKKIDMDASKGVLVIAGTAGQVVIFNINNEEVEKELQVFKCFYFFSLRFVFILMLSTMANWGNMNLCFRPSM